MGSANILPLLGERLEQILARRTEIALEELRDAMKEAYFSRVEDCWTDTDVSLKIDNLVDDAKKSVRHQERKKIVDEITPSILGG